MRRVIHRAGAAIEVVVGIADRNQDCDAQGSSGTKTLIDQVKIDFSTDGVRLYQHYQEDQIRKRKTT
jgi:hypothetical protein